MDAVLAIAAEHGLEVLEDCAQAHDAEYKGQKVGALGRAGAFSFYPGKNLGAYGEGGAVVTDDKKLAERMRMIRDHGSAKKYHHEFVGYNYRMSGFQGAVLGVKLKYLTQWTDERRRAAASYRNVLSELPLQLPPEKDHVRHVYHLFVARAANRDAIMPELGDSGVASGIHYPVPLHLAEAFSDLGYSKGDFPVAEAVADEIFSLPMYPELTNEMIQHAGNCLAEILDAVTV